MTAIHETSTRRAPSTSTRSTSPIPRSSTTRGTSTRRCVTSTTSTTTPHNDLYIAARHEDVFHISRDERDCTVNRFGVRPKIAGDMSIITLDGDEHVAHPPPHQHRASRPAGCAT